MALKTPHRQASPIAALKLALTSLKSAPPGTVRKRLLKPLKERSLGAGRAVANLQIRVADKFFGMARGNQLFWRARSIPKSWLNVEVRLFFLTRHAPQLVPQFAALGFRHSVDPITLLNMARSSLTKDSLAQGLMAADLGPESWLIKRVRHSVDYAGAIIAISALLLDADRAAAINEAIDQGQPIASRRRRALVDSLGYTPAKPPEATVSRGIADSGFRTHKHHRLIIAPDFKDKRSLTLLFGDADRVTIYAMDDLYGKADFSDTRMHNRMPDLTIEHPRTRITRFSAAYQQLHEDTRAASEQILAQIAGHDADGAALVGTSRPFAELALGDELFFRSLPLAALELLLTAKEFDHIVIASTDSSADALMCMLLAGVPSIKDHPSLEITSISRNLSRRAAFERTLGLILPRTALDKAGDEDADPPQDPAPEASLPAVAHADFRPVASFLDYTAGVASRLQLWPETDKPRVLLIAGPVGAYDGSTAHYYTSLSRAYNLRTAFFGGNLVKFGGRVADVGGTFANETVLPIAVRTKHSSRALNAHLADRVLDAAELISAPTVRHVVTVLKDRFVQTTLVNYFTFYHTCEAWLARLQAEGQLPRVVVQTPLRNCHVAAFCSLSRAVNVPTIALEPHGLNASYCRYSTVASDYYGVISTFFQDEAAKGFEIPKDRCIVVGSPRLMTPKNYQMEAARQAARGKVTLGQGIRFADHNATLTFLSQPTNWAQVAEVWRIILQATDDLGVQVLLKTHPEETPSRVAAYLKIAETLGCADRVRRLEGDATTAIEVADLVLSGYSATVVESTLLRHPVFCVTNGETEYPLDQHRVVGAPIYRDAPGLRGAIQHFMITPDAFIARTSAFLTQERQLLDGYEGAVLGLVDSVIAMPPEAAIRPAETLPRSVFLQGPHKVYEV